MKSECGDKSIYAYNDFVKNWLQAWCAETYPLKMRLNYSIFQVDVENYF